MYLPDGALNIICILESAGFSAYVVGGYVRDALMGRPGADIDICTSARPERVTELFSGRGYRVIPTGIEHGTVTVLAGGAGYEVTTFRVDGDYSDARRPDSVRFTGDIWEDLARRDFTVNAMAFAPSAGLADPFGGRGDIESGLIRAVGEPGARFAEDALRMLRAVRFAASLGFAIEPETRSAIISMSDRLRLVSPERVASELCGILLSERPEALLELRGLGLLRHTLPELEPAFEDGQAERALAAATLLPPELEQRLAVLFSGDSTTAGRALRRLRFSRRITDRTTELARLSGYRAEPEKQALKRFLRTLKNVTYTEYEAVRNASLISKGDFDAAEVLKFCRDSYDIIVGQNEPFLISQLAVSGRDIEALGHRGPEVGRILRELLEYVIDNPAENNCEALMAHVGSPPSGCHLFP